MKFQTSILLAGLAAQGAYSSVLERAACNANNCLRLVRGTNPAQRPTLASRQADCSSFMQVTVTPAATTSTMTATVTGAAKRDENAEIEPRQMTATPSAVPTYAQSVCMSSDAYSSACSCVSITKSTITLAIPTSIVTITQTENGTPTSSQSTIPSFTPRDTTCSNPKICDYDSACSGSNSCTGFCQPDTDSVGHCSDDQAAIACSAQEDKKCTTNADCVAGANGFCINDCCGFSSCYYESYEAFCVNGASTSRMFRRKAVRGILEKTGQPVKPQA